MKTLEWRVEELCHKAWPALREVRLGNWTLRMAPGISRRANSLNPLNSAAGDVDATLDAATPLFHAQGLPVLFRVPTPLLDPAVDRLLEARGFTAEGETTTFAGDLTAAAAQPAGDVECLPRADDA